MVAMRAWVGCVAVGFATGALADGFILHQVLQWHHVWSERTPDGTLRGLEANTVADGIFHVAFLAVLLVGLVILAGRPVGLRALVGLGLIGWGSFQVVDHLLFHMALGAHHIRMGVDNYALYDWASFGIGVILMGLGYVVARPAGRGKLSDRR